MTAESVPVACALTAADRPAHERLLHELARHAVGVDARLGIARITFRGAPRERLEAFVAAEAACCPFFRLALDDRDDDVLLTVSAPAEGQAVLDALAASLAGGAPPLATPR
jgi:hypothetical protein